MTKKMRVLKKNQTWEIVYPPEPKKKEGVSGYSRYVGVM